MSKQHLIDQLSYGIRKIQAYQADRETYIDAFEFRDTVLYEISMGVEFKFIDDDDVKPLLDSFIELFKWLINDSANDINSLAWILDMVLLGRTVFEDAEKHWWWYLPETVLTKAQRNDWDHIIAKYPEV